jgi:hypothetical protein
LAWLELVRWVSPGLRLKIMLKFANPKKILLIAIIVTAFFALALLPNKSHAVHLQNHSVQVSSAIINATASHNFQFTYPSTSVVGSVVLLYCDGGALQAMPCNAPAGLDATGAALTSQTGNTGFSIDGANSTANKIVLTRVPLAGTTVLSTYGLNNIINPSTANATTYIRISTYPTTDGTGPYNDDGAVAYSTVNPFEVGAFVPPFIKLCVGITVAVDCSSMSGNSINLGVLSANATRFAKSEFSAGTNSFTGYNIFALGTTMTSGNNVIPALNPAGTSKVGVSQFGLNLRANSSPAIGAEPQGSGTGVPLAGYNTPNLFKFANGDNIASSSLTTEFNKMTASYIVNINSSQPPGIYATTITYLAVGSF